MKRLITLSLALALTIPVLAANKAPRQYKPGSAAKVRQLSADPTRLPRLMAQYAAARNGVGAAALTDIRSARLLVFPAAGNVRGANGEFFRSDVTLVSYNQADHQHAIALWLRNGAPSSEEPPAIEITLDPNTYYTFTDFVGETLGVTNQLGTILIVPVDDLGDIDFANAAIDGYSRIWTNQPNATGTVAQPFEAVDPYSLFAFETASVMGLRQDAQYRSNFGIVNVDDEDHQFVVRFLGETAQAERTIVVPAGSMIHTSIPAGNYGALAIEVDVDNVTAPWIVYGTSNDNITGDGWVSIGSGVLTPEDLDDIDGGF